VASVEETSDRDMVVVSQVEAEEFVIASVVEETVFMVCFP
jgi:hypothetical protein